MAALQSIFAPNGSRLTVASPYATQFGGLLDDLTAAGYGPKQEQSGGYNPRNIAGTQTPSMHAHGAAIDVNWNENPRGGMGKIDPQMARDLAAKHGMTWGGDWKNPDPMHFEVSGRAPVLPKLELLDTETGANARRWKAAPMDYQWNDAGPPEEADWRRRLPAPMSGGMNQPTAAPTSSPQPQEQARQPSLLDQIVARAGNPLFQQGLGLFLAASQGKDLNEGLNAGSSRASAMQDVMMKNLALQKQTEQAAKIKEMMNNPAILGQVPPALIEFAKATGDPAPIIQHLTKAGGTDDIKEFEYAKKAGFEGSFTDWMKSKKNMQGEYAKQLVYGTNATGDVVPMQAGSRGDLVASKLPDGVRLQRDPIKVDLGDRWGFMDPTTRTIVNMVPKNLAEAESQKQQGEARGKAKASLPAVESAANNIITKVEAVLNDPQIDKMVGYSGYIPNMSPEARGFMAKVKQLEGTAFLQAFESLKGAGAITETEGAQAKAALIRFQEMVQTGTDYRAALRDYIDQVRRITDVARQRAGSDPSQSPTPQQVAPTQQQKRYRFNPTTGELE